MYKTFLFFMSITLFILLFSLGVSAKEYSDTEHWAKNYINYVTDQGYFEGTTNSTFEPDGVMTRGMFVTALARYEKADLSKYKLDPFNDITNDQYFTKPILWAYENNIVEGVSSNIFAPNDAITREQSATIINRYLSMKNNVPIGISTVEEQITYFNDINTVSNWALIPVKNMKNFNIFKGDQNNNFNPKNNLTRAECAVIFSRLDNKSFENYEPPAPVYTYLSGKASAYSEGLVGGPTASGERLSGTAYTVAVPISQYKIYAGRHVEIVYNGITVVARCNDCGGFAKYGRVLDLSPGVFKALGFSSSSSWGVRTVQYRWID